MEDWQRGPVIDNRPWPRAAMALATDMTNPDKFAIVFEIVNDRPYPLNPATGLHTATFTLPVEELANFLNRTTLGSRFREAMKR